MDSGKEYGKGYGKGKGGKGKGGRGYYGGYSSPESGVSSPPESCGSMSPESGPVWSHEAQYDQSSEGHWGYRHQVPSTTEMHGSEYPSHRVGYPYRRPPWKQNSNSNWDECGEVSTKAHFAVRGAQKVENAGSRAAMAILAPFLIFLTSETLFRVLLKFDSHSHVDPLAEQWFSSVDLNCDGALDREEVVRALRPNFSDETEASIRSDFVDPLWAKWDSDSNATLTVDEISSLFQIVSAPKPKDLVDLGEDKVSKLFRWMKKVDSNADSKLDYAEATIGLMAESKSWSVADAQSLKDKWSKWDANSDKKLDLTEVLALDGLWQWILPEDAARILKEKNEAAFKAIDTDGDERLDCVEIVAYLETGDLSSETFEAIPKDSVHLSFQSWDFNADGFIDAEEFVAQDGLKEYLDSLESKKKTATIVDDMVVEPVVPGATVCNEPTFLELFFGLASFEEASEEKDVVEVPAEPLSIDAEIEAVCDRGLFSSLVSIFSLFGSGPDTDDVVDSTDDSVIDQDLPAYPLPETEYVESWRSAGWLIYEPATWVGHGFWPMNFEFIPAPRKQRKSRAAKKPKTKKAKTQKAKDSKGQMMKELKKMFGPNVHVLSSSFDNNKVKDKKAVDFFAKRDKMLKERLEKEETAVKKDTEKNVKDSRKREILEELALMEEYVAKRKSMHDCQKKCHHCQCGHAQSDDDLSDDELMHELMHFFSHQSKGHGDDSRYDRDMAIAYDDFFNQMDVNGSGYLDFEECTHGLVTLWDERADKDALSFADAADQLVVPYWKQWDYDGNNEIDFDEYMDDFGMWGTHLNSAKDAFRKRAGLKPIAK